MTEKYYDFKFGWRWLLPLQRCSTICLHGFDEAEQRFWERAFPSCAFSPHDATADARVLDADRHIETSSVAEKDFTHAKIICVVGTGSNVSVWRAQLKSQFPQVREYGLLPASNPRVIIPLSSRKNTLIALALHRPGRWIARVGLWAARILASMGNNLMLRRYLLLVATRDPSAPPTGAEQSQVARFLTESGLDYALYLGTMDENRKTVVLPLGGSDPVTILKVGETPTARRSLENEAATLEALRKSPIAHQAPRPTGMVDNDGVLTLFQEFRPRRSVLRKSYDAAVTDFLGKLTGISRQSRPLFTILTDMTADGVESPIACEPPYLATVWMRLQSLAEMGVSVWEHRSHGDFAPWNCSWTEQGLFVFDWEESKECDLAFSDAFYFVTATALHVQRKPNAQHTIDTALHLAEQVAHAGRIAGVDVRAHLACWLIGRIGKAPHYSEMLQVLGQRWR